jgi:hypothetical protein
MVRKYSIIKTFLNEFLISKVSFSTNHFSFQNSLEILYASKVNLPYINKSIVHNYARKIIAEIMT